MAQNNQENGLDDARRLGAALLQNAARSAVSGFAVPIAIVIAVILIVTFIILLGGGGGATPGLANNNTPPVGDNPGSPPVPAGPNLNYTIKFRDTTVVPVKSTSIDAIKQLFPKAQVQYYDIIVDRAIQAGWNPAFVLTLWIEETGASQNTKIAAGGAGVLPASNGHLGCAPWELQTINESLDCLFKNFSGYSNDQF